ncbi:MAG: pyrimidine 5'-nucleotidase [Zoogloeaceae bacterium]|jgi:putative hydrolase of the HAD superfamily|nr:pyrimidine 5'-nucleotidase [Zoogloeaceae bacterium]
MRAPPVAWIFDLDDTLHDASAHIFPHINQAMRRYIEALLNVDAAEANRIRQTYWHRYGATLLGLMRHHAIDPLHFLQATHDVPVLEKMVAFNPAVKILLKKLPGRKILYSNSPAHYASAILAITGMTRLFNAVYTVESSRFQPKPSLAGFRRLLRVEKLLPHRCVMVEDSAANLRAAKQLGLKTVWISRHTRQPPWVDVRIPSILALPVIN